MNDIQNSIRKLIEQNIEMTVPVNDIKESEDLFKLGIDSISCIKLIIAIETEFGFEFTDEDLDMDNMKTIATITGYVEGKTANV